MKKITLPLHPREATKKILRVLPNRRLREVIEKRYGLVSGEEETLEAIGKGYGITRERVRQIEADALKRLSSAPALDLIRPVFVSFAKHLDDCGGVSEERSFFNSLAEKRFHPHLRLLFELSPDMKRRVEDEFYSNRLHRKAEVVEAAESALKKTVDDLSSARKLVSEERLFDMLSENARTVFGYPVIREALGSILGISKLIKKNPYGELGLEGWEEVSPSGVRDKAYVAFLRHGRPMHFTEAARAIDKAGWGAKKTHPQTVHNELIKDGRFVLVGRGLYALREWGYEPGTVADVIVSVLKETGGPLGKTDVIKKVLEKRRVKENTIFLNLQNKKRFKKTAGGYTLV